MVLAFIVGAVVGFVVGIFVGRKNTQKVEKAAAEVNKVIGQVEKKL
jgi:hypothetical protein